MSDEFTALQDHLAKLENLLSVVLLSDRYQFTKPIVGGPNGLQLEKNGGKISLFGSTPIKQWSSGTGRQDVTSNTGTAANVGFQATGNLGGTGYSLGDLVAFLKTRGDIAP